MVKLASTGTLEVNLENRGNPDFRQNPDEPVWGSVCEKVEVNSLKEAVDACREYIDENELGGGNWTGGQVYRDGVAVAVISYNGRVWEAKEDGGRDPHGKALDVEAF